MTLHKQLPKLDLNVTNRCNYRCRHCAFDSGNTLMSEPSLDELSKLLYETKTLGGKKIDITGGEPTIREDLKEIVSMAKSLDYKVELVTNGSLISFQRFDELLKVGLDSVAVSLDGASFNTHVLTRGIGHEAYKKTLDFIDYVIKTKTYLKINTVAFNYNLEDIPRITDFCIEKKIDEHGIYYFTPVGRGACSNEKSVEPLRWLNFIRTTMEPYTGRMKISIEVPLIENSFEKNTNCLLSDDPYHLQILPNGNVYPCAILASYNKSVGNISLDSIKKIWRDETSWKKYKDSTEEDVFSKNGFCFSNDQNIKVYGSLGYKFVCPLKKFSLEEVL